MEFIESLKLLEVELGDKKFFNGENFGFLDICLIGFYSWFYVYEKFGNLDIEAECPKLIAWARMCVRVESVAKSVPSQEKVYNLISEVRKRIGVE